MTLSAKAQSAANRARYKSQYVPPVDHCVARLLPDQECSLRRGNGKYPYLWRFYGIKRNIAYWMTIVLQGDTGTVNLALQWQEWFNVNNSPAARAYNAGHGPRPQVGWVDFKPWPLVKQITTAGYPGHETFVVVDHIDGNRAYIQHYDNGKHPADYPIDYLQQVGIAYPDGRVTGPDCGKLLIFPISNAGKKLYVNTQDISFLRAL